MSPSQVQTLLDQLSKNAKVEYKALTINGRLISHLGCSEAIVWFDFNSICAVPRSQLDYFRDCSTFSDNPNQ